MGKSLDRLHLLNLGLIYCNGSNARKFQVLLKHYASPKGNKITKLNLSILLDDLFYIAVILIPAMHLNTEEREIEKKKAEFIKKATRYFLYDIF